MCSSGRHDVKSVKVGCILLRIYAQKTDEAQEQNTRYLINEALRQNRDEQKQQVRVTD